MNLELAAAGGAKSSVLVALYEPPLMPSAAAQWMRQLEGHYDIYVLREQFPAAEDVAEFSAALCRYCDYRGLRRITVVGVGPGASLGMAFAVAAEKLLRRLIVVDGASRLKPGLLVRAIDVIEESLPLGFPLRALSKAYDARSALHRIRCPTLVVTTPSISPYLEQQSRLIASRVPNSWNVALGDDFLTSSGGLTKAATKMVLDFGQIAVKRPQKAA